MEALKEQYGLYIERIKNDQPRLYFSLKNMELKILSDYQFSILFQNKAIKEEFIARVKPAMISFLRDAINNPKLDVIEELAGVDDIKKPTFKNDSERLKTMADKNPAILRLKSKFNLDFE